MLPLSGSWTLDRSRGTSAALPLFDEEPERHAYLDYRRWAFESAALDLALRQAGMLARRRGRPRGEAGLLRGLDGHRLAAAERSRPRAGSSHYPALRFKLDANPDWTRRRSSAELAATGAVDSIDLKGQYRGTVVDTPADPALYRRVAEGFPDAWLEDPGLTEETTPVARAPSRPGHLGRDHPLGRGHRVASLAAADGEREAVSLRFGRAAVRGLRLLRGERASARTAAASGSSARAAATSSSSPRSSTPTTPNDVAPREYNLGPQPGLPASPLEVTPRETGFLRAVGRRMPGPYGSSVPRKSSTSMSGSDSSFALPRAPSATDTFAIVTSSGASTMFTKS